MLLATKRARNGRYLRKPDPVCCRRQRSSRTLSCRERRRCCRGPRSQPPGGENRLPEKRTQKHDNKDAKDKAPPTGTEGVIVLGGSAGRDRSRRNNWSPAQQAQ